MRVFESNNGPAPLENPWIDHRPDRVRPHRFFGGWTSRIILPNKPRRTLSIRLLRSGLQQEGLNIRSAGLEEILRVLIISSLFLFGKKHSIWLGSMNWKWCDKTQCWSTPPEEALLMKRHWRCRKRFISGAAIDVFERTLFGPLSWWKLYLNATFRVLHPWVEQKWNLNPSMKPRFLRGDSLAGSSDAEYVYQNSNIFQKKKIILGDKIFEKKTFSRPSFRLKHWVSRLCYSSYWCFCLARHLPNKLLFWMPSLMLKQN